MYYEKYMNRVPHSSGWASDEEIAGSRGCLRGRWDQPHDEGGVVLFNRLGDLVVDGGPECRHVLIIGATGTGKSRLIILPSLLYSLYARNRRSLVVFDVKGELRRATVEAARKNGYRVLDINFYDPAAGNGWNPFHRANQKYFEGGEKNRRKAWKLLEDIIASLFNDGNATKVDPFWRNSSANLFRGICSALWSSGNRLSMERILAMSDSIPADKDEDFKCTLFNMVERGQEFESARRMLRGFRSGSSTTRGNVMACYRGYLSPVAARDDVLEMISRDETVEFGTLGDEPTVLYISLPDDTTALGGLQGILLTQLMQELNECAMKNGGCLPVRTDIYLDELCNIHPAIPALETALTIGRSRGIRYVLAIQSFAQLVGVYGSAAETISSNASTWIALNIAKDQSFRERLSSLCGVNSIGDPLITPSQLALLSYEQAIVIRERCAPYFSRLEDLSGVQERLRAAGEAPSRRRPLFRRAEEYRKIA